jgi:hypothetical protein
MNEVTSGQVVIMVEVDAAGKLTDWLLLGASHRELINGLAQSVPTWDFRAARYDGQPVLAQAQFTIGIGDGRGETSRVLRLPSQQKNAMPVNSNGQRLLNLNRGATGIPVPQTPPEFSRPGEPASRPFDYQVCPLDELDRPLVAITRVAPLYAAGTENIGMRVRVQVTFFIDEHGKVRLPAVPAGTQPELADLAIKAMKEWKFEPPTRQGQPVLVAAEQEFAFAGGQ